ncbi:Maf family nucleotide pyrophosphatase [Belliella kenyensis]|uniref:dTTP/UTP pyrophosphatase n=1 Tax=Belliella kenyensis TaxID=1472724 RepID=A0ABV8EJB7_9BACT|nr:Maf family nucleotide pyrophosphatase [Belliella kenyensis]MCH7400968.1 Maf family nucleotide pyrophosphatase [Belliella kenyensis]MDN3603966.1 Maf family nucleotide pyrophosphatase [Belliella kenyensis]
MIDLKNKQLILASKSPRRKELLAGLGVDFIIKTKDTDESFPDDMDPFEVAGYLSKKKGDAFAHELMHDEILLTADTVVILDGKILNKPKDAEEAVAMITALSGKTHHVVTGISLTHARGQSTQQDKVKVEFAELSSEEISYYVNNFSPLDKAGAYGIQEWIGYVAVSRIEGSFYTVMGFPVHLVYQALKKLIDGE